ncbi:MAG TPA: hypothetical protein VKQ29_13810 [Aliidongia sp.]|nr:hypothetical protein [Aliidongia sp.]
MSIPPSGDLLSMVLFLTLLACTFGLVGFVWVKLGNRPKPIDYRGLSIHLNPGLPAGKIVLTDGKWQPLGETEPAQFDTVALPRDCAAALFSTRDFAAFAARRSNAPRRLSQHSLQA